MSMLLKRMLPLLALFGAALVPTAAQAQRKDARTEISALTAKNVAAFNAGHPEVLGHAYASDAIVIPPNDTLIRGAAAIAAWWADGWKRDLRNLVLATTEVYAEGNIATETGTWSLDMPLTAGGAPVHDRGRFMLLWKRSPTAGWQIFRHIYNSDVPMPQTTSAMKDAGEKGDMAHEMAHDMAGASDSVWLVLNPIKADKRADYEQWLSEFGKAGANASDPSIRRRFAGAHAIIPAAPNPDGTWTYVIMLHPYYAGEDYMINSLTPRILPAADTARVNALLAGARAAPPTVIRGRLMETMVLK